MGKGGGKTQVVSYPTNQQTSQETKVEPWAPTAQPLQDLMNEALAQYYSEPSVVGYRAPEERQVPIYEDIPVVSTITGSPVTEADLYQRYGGTENRFGALPRSSQQAISNALDAALKRSGFEVTQRYNVPSALRGQGIFSNIPKEPEYVYAGTRGGRRVTIPVSVVEENPIYAINQGGLNWQDIVNQAGIGGSRTQTSGGGRRITGYRTETTPGSPGVYIAPETRMLGDFLSQEALNRGYYEQPLQMYGDYLTRAAGGGYNIDPYGYNIENDYGITDPELISWQGGINPYARSMYDQMAEQVRSNVMGSMNLAGRIGSGANTRILTEELGDLGTRFYQPIYEAERQREYQAAAQNAAAEQAAINRQLGIEETNLARQLEIDAANRAFQQRAAELLPNVHQARRDLTTWIANLLERAGEVRKGIQDQPRLERTQALQRAMQMITPLSGIGGITTMQGSSSGTQAQPYFYNPAASAVGGLTGLLGGVGGLLGGIAAL